ncbi:glycosyltransferase family 4 protein [Microvirga sesbaniae]|uniref:glycosyltransferase family 4 protein n=1 Tax=Microvirga sesbaniae TaxID=681392 RepID=UPI0021C58F52|nr:glycosyltransferase family 4 protein [Microvirga sp. HBU67692]
MHVALVGDHPLPGEDCRGGVQRVVEVLRHEIAKSVRVTLLVPSATKSLRYSDEYGEIIYLKRPPGPGFLTYWSWTSIDVFKELERLNPDVVHVQDVAGLALFWSSRKALRCPVVFTAHGVLEADLLHSAGGDTLRRLTATIRSKIVEIVERKSRRRYSDVIVINDYVLEAMPDVAQRRHHFIPNPVDDIFFSAPYRRIDPEPDYNLIQVGLVCPRKNVSASIDILAELVKHGHKAHLNIIGPIRDREYYSYCSNKIRHLDLATFVTFHGGLTPIEIADRMDRADLLVLPSKQETAPMVVAEAHCRGLPVAGPRAFGLRSMVSEGSNGIFLDGPRPENDARRIADFLQRGIDREAIRAGALVKYELGSVIARTLAVYRTASAKHSTDALTAVMAGA